MKALKIRRCASALGGIALGLLALAAGPSCGRARNASAPPPVLFKNEGRLTVIKENGRDTVITIAIEIADREEERVQGLMRRRSMPDTCGMLFVFDTTGLLSFWMKDTYIPLDILFIGDDLEIMEIRENTLPLSTAPILARQPGRYALEVNAWFCRERGIEEGDRVRWARGY